MSEQQAPYIIEGRQPTIFRAIHDKDNPYVITDRRPIDNPKLSYKAKGILTYLLSRPDGWEVNVPDLVNHSIDGKAAVRTGLKELRDAGHIKYNTLRKGGYIEKWIIEVYELPQPPDMGAGDEGDQVLDTDFREIGKVLLTDFQQVENQQIENRTQVLSNLSNNETNIYKPKKSKSGTGLAFMEMNQSHLEEKKRIDGIIRRIELAIKVKPNFGRPGWETVVKKLLKLDPEQTIEEYAEWANHHQYDAPKIGQIAMHPTIILDTWPAAFPEARLRPKPVSASPE